MILQLIRELLRALGVIQSVKTVEKAGVVRILGAFPTLMYKRALESAVDQLICERERGSFLLEVIDNPFVLSAARRRLGGDVSIFVTEECFDQAHNQTVGWLRQNNPGVTVVLVYQSWPPPFSLRTDHRVLAEGYTKRDLRNLAEALEGVLRK